MEDRIIREQFEEVLDYFHGNRFRILSDRDVDGHRTVTLSKYGAILVLVLEGNVIAFDTYADLKAGIYELGELNTLVSVMLQAKRMCLDRGFREMNTTERLYPRDRRGSETRTSGL
ncbi:MAG: hypothetical protein D6732_28190 [Methanobacteriota archaeon]|nr:MAG: hypothetical protein D6732_28190 [Euryarchaeota archaeon]